MRDWGIEGMGREKAMLEGAGVARNRVGEWPEYDEWDEWGEWGKMIGGKQASCGAGNQEKPEKAV